MWEEAFLARLARKRELADQGHVELEDQLGPERDLGPAVRTGLLKPAPPCCPLQRYHGLVPSRKGARYLDYCGEHHLITVRAGQVPAFEAVLALDQHSGEVFVPSAPPLPFGLEPAPPARPQRHGKTAPLAYLANLREEERRSWLREGYSDFEEIRAALSIPEEALLACGLFRHRIEGQDLHALPLVPQGLGEHFLLLVVPWDLLFIKPDMARALFLLIDRDRAAEWTTTVANTGLPMGDAWKVPARHPLRRSAA